MENAIRDKSKAFAIRIVKLYQYLSGTKREYILSKQLLRSGTSIGANVYEALHGQSKADFIAKLSISLKEASETGYWLEILSETGYIESREYESMKTDCDELMKILTSILKSSRK